MPEHSPALERQLMQTSQDALCFFAALFPRNMAQASAAAIPQHADVNYLGGRERSGELNAHICQWVIPPWAAQASGAESTPSVGRDLSQQ